MFLEKLIVNSNLGQIREVTFKRGLNLIIDESTSDRDTESGNSVGKTTLLRVVDYCFGSTGTDIYTDNEFKTTNKEILNFLNNNEVSFTLTLNHGKGSLILQRGFPSDKILTVNNNEFSTLSEYKQKIENLMFKIKRSKPSLRSIMPKFIRKDITTMSNTLFFLHNNTRKDEYEILFLYLFGFTDHKLLVERLKLSFQLRKIERRIASLKQGRSISATKQVLKIIERDIALAEDKIKSFQIEDKYKEEVASLNEIKKEISNSTINFNNLVLKRQLNEETLKELSSNKSDIDPKTIRELYSEAQKLFPPIQKQFEEVLNFHNQLIDKKIDFVSSQLEYINVSITSAETDLSILLEKESHLLRNLSNLGSFDDLALLQKDLNQLFERRGKESQFIVMLQEEIDSRDKHRKEIEELNGKLKLFLKDFEEKVTKFNLYFSDYSKLLYEEEYFLTFDLNDKGKVNFGIDNVKGNVGSGKKKAQITAFDFAFISLQNEFESSLPRFVLHDSIEDVHKNQINTLFKIANSINGQYIVSILRDKLTFLESEYVEANKILSLSQEEMFFKM